MPNIFDTTDPKAVPEAPKGRQTPDIPIGMALDMTEAEYEERDYTPPAEEAPAAEEKPIDPSALEASIEENVGAPVEFAEPSAEEQEPAKVEPRGEETVKPVDPEPENSVDDEKIEDEPEGEKRIPVKPGAGFEKGAGPSEAATAATNMMRALINSSPKEPVDKGTISTYFTPLMDIANRAERVAVKEALQVTQTEAIHDSNFVAVVGIQNVLDLIAAEWTTGAKSKRKTAEERAYEKRVKVTREGASVIIAMYELLKSITPEGADIEAEAKKESEQLIIEAGQFLRWKEGGSAPAEEPDTTVLGRRVLTAFRSAVKGINLEDHLRPTTHDVVTVKKKAPKTQKVETPDAVPEANAVQEHIEGLFSRLQPGQWVSIQQLVDQPTKQFPDESDRPVFQAVRSLIYEGKIKGVDGYTEQGVDGGWKPLK